MNTVYQPRSSRPGDRRGWGPELSPRFPVGAAFVAPASG